MPKARFSSSHQGGFSLVELMVALVFIGLLMSGMAKVYQSSLNTFYASSDTIASGRRNRVAMDLLYDDLNAAGQYLTSMTVYPTFSAANPGFYILPNQPFTGTDVIPAKAISDQLYMYMDEALPFEGTLMDPSGTGATFATTSNADLVERAAKGLGGAEENTLDKTMMVRFKETSHAAMVDSGQIVIFKDQWGPKQIKEVVLAGDTVTFKPVDQTDTEKGLYTGINPLNKARHYAGTGVFAGPTGPTPSTGGAPMVFVRAAQMVRYSIQPMFLDPSNPTVGLPCLVREQGAYSPAGFVVSPATPLTIIAENVTGFKTYLSADGGRTWAGQGLTTKDFTTGWTNGILATVNTQLAAVGLPHAPDASDPNWFRETPLMVRVDLTTRSAVKRVEHSAVANTAEYRERLQTLYMVPRHFGLSFK